ncbi:MULTISPECIES: acetyl-CoA C-acetyltransferase [Rhodobacterales]|jgi:acetyl-CoA C-acetyltransferase|uniref:Acetyl-CoA acetyltransferase n=1 Tax=Phaeobacter gallaeciensis TaxID=60890 RepID=A0A1B0ZTQ2_9RHOB|nr:MULTISPECIES: acetyl-CoA C-acetyltransferase [Phaeobacter]MEE2633162.1 acetyl-CoA C-acetyltransferase [Pseudomonadota bacterium]ANP37541.1 acetyl-CoA acetyltransferase [Phaeobacter gallaeciensis]MDE4141059.1 acetyl-CoA C-acetyltransferase [Phaeobacter gallaeciensis]MDE4149504.1 acetyl-CoA C-acetyltransferase [Phaeobacter gallaeciensis]MDE4154046.1 acetyl-CoA C-acetyltransferase [Phaeobacter gallaeciensis]
MFEDVVICEPVRTPVGRFGGQFRDLHAHELGRMVIEGLLARTDLPGDRVDEVIFAQCYPSMDAPALGRVVGLDAGLPISIGGYQIDRRCGSGLQAVINAVMQVATGGSSLVIAGGAESMSNAPFYSTKGRWGIKGTAMVFDDALAKGRVTAGGINHPVPGGMLETAENLRQEYNIGREEQDAFAVESHRRAVAAQDGGLFDDEIIPVSVKSRKGEETFSKDEHPRPEATMESMAKLRPIRGGIDSQATVTAGNASGQNDGASAAIITTRAIAEELGLKAYARIKSWAVAGVGPEVMGIGPVPSVAKALDRAGMALKDIDLIELNEAFAAQVLACTREWQFADSDFERMNVNGSGISLGHPVGATGGRIMAGLLREMHRRDALYGVETMCIGGGQGLAAIFEKV